MAVEILAKPMPMFRTEYDLVESGIALVWTPVYLELVLPSGIARWRIVGGFHDGYIVYVEKKDKDIFMVPDQQGQGERYSNV
ncbi:MAG: hypothetical protein G01um101448_763 [Parcubacteria group bacterium Gr01-1014_48]|nr:MAG: hypothetical protein Greene041614_929 [Parcubacteria group bacterium Greene0416_14]TSC73451.1 MAG: hypothetical protein G01um101448_763 [Parcubacteria group bacterium Gr01-1014_48]TSD00039.1 MAG: hypothetical protein Greene101415_985 [Parcubacteria group bacterium Greene1014_15]TSD07404.1 MAG: hypothetical protein Greene07144_922 [Parcubacteria group bacterium Greene0714_4]